MEVTLRMTVLMDMDIAEKRGERKVLDIESVGAEVQVPSSSADIVPQYALEVGCTASLEGWISYFSC